MRYFIIIGILAMGAIASAPSVAYAESSLANFRAYPLASRGYGLIQQRKYDEARKLFARAVEIMPSNVDYRLQYANLLVSQGNVYKALEVVQDGLKYVPNHQGLIMLEDGLQKQLGTYEDSFKQTAEEDPAASSVTLTSQRFTQEQREIVQKTIEGTVAAADDVPYCQQLLEESYNKLEGVDALNGAYCALEEKQNVKAIHLLETASLSTESEVAVQALNELGFLYTAKNDHLEAAKAWRKSVAYTPNAELEVNIARSYRLAGDKEEAETLLQDILQRDDLRPGAQILALEEEGFLYDSLDDHQKAYATGEKTLKAAPTAKNYYYQALRAQRLGKHKVALAHLEAAHKLQPKVYTYLYSLAYAYRYDGQDVKAATTFEQALALEESTVLRQDYAYTLKEIGERHKAADQFVRLQGSVTDPEDIDAMRLEARELSSDWTTFGSISYRDGVFSGIDSTGNQTYNDSFQYGVETIYSPEHWQKYGRRFQLYGQLFASSETGQFNYDNDSTQAALGGRFTPLRDTEWYIYLARLISIGDNALDDTQLRTSYSYTDGFEYNALQDSWNYLFFGVDGSYLFDEEQLFVTSEARAGRAFKKDKIWVLTPHAVLAATALDGQNRDSENLDIGFGISAKAWLGQTQTQYPDKSVELIVQWRTPISSDDNKSGPFLRLVMQF